MHVTSQKCVHSGLEKYAYWVPLPAGTRASRACRGL